MTAPDVRCARPTGPALFARYAYPPNALGYCGPADHAALRDAASDGADRDLARLARQFGGAWPYLQLIAAANRLGDPLDRRVVRAYWVGNELLDRVSLALLGRSLDDRFRRVAGAGWARLADCVAGGAVPHHNLHVFAVYPWVGMLRAGRSGEPLRVLDQCRIRWGRVESVDGSLAVVWSRPLAWDGRSLSLGPARGELVRLTVGPRGVAGTLAPGDWVSMHWDWVCERLTGRDLRALTHYSAASMAAVNRAARPPALAG